MSYRSELRCFTGCAGTFPLTEAIYRCPQCGGLLDIHHDIDALRDKSAGEWKDLFSRRNRGSQWPFDSGVWSKREWVAPDMPDRAIVSLGEGGTHLMRAERYGQSLGLPNLYVKMCGNSHTGSFKDLGMTVLVSTVRKAQSEGRKLRAIACASTGDTSASLAAYGAASGLPVVVLLPRGKISTAQLVQPLANGALVLALDTDFDGCMKIVQRLAEEDIVYLANSMNPLRIEGQKTVAIEIAEQLGWKSPDWVILPSGNLGNAYALYRGFHMMKELGLIDRYPRLALAQAEAANPLYLAYRAHKGQLGAEPGQVRPVEAKTTLATAIQIGNPVSAPRAVRALRETNGVVEQASEEELAEAAARADRHGLFTCPHTAVALAALEKLLAKGTISPDERVVVISTASGLKFAEFKVGYHEKNLSGVSSRQANAPVELAADFGRVVDAIVKRG